MNIYLQKLSQSVPGMMGYKKGNILELTFLGYAVDQVVSISVSLATATRTIERVHI